MTRFLGVLAIILTVVAAPMVVALAATPVHQIATGLPITNPCLVATILALPALYLLGGPFDPRD